MDYEAFIATTKEKRTFLAFVARGPDIKKAIIQTSWHPNPDDAIAELRVMSKSIVEALARADKIAMGLT